MARTETQVGFSVPSIIAIIAALLSLLTGAFWGLILAVIAIVCGVIGVFMSLSPNVRGGVLSITSLIIAAIGIVIALFKALAWLF